MQDREANRIQMHAFKYYIGQTYLFYVLQSLHNIQKSAIVGLKAFLLWFLKAAPTFHFFHK